ncbi:MAG: SCO family protein [Verrucomicrobiales bacterium]
MIRCLSTIAVVVSFLAISGCGRETGTEGPEPSPQTARGVLRSDPDLTLKTVLVDHEAIPGVMPAMTMQFSFREGSGIASLKSGDSIRFALEEDDEGWWIHSVEKIDAVPGRSRGASDDEAESGGTVLRTGDRIPDFRLVDQRGRPLTNDTLAEQPFLLTFIFTRCPIMEFCPRLSENFRQVRDAADADPALKGGFGLVSVSFDEEDTPEMLAAYGDNLEADPDRWRFATGDPEEIEKLTRAFALRIERSEGTLDHSLATALVDGEGIVREIWRGNGWQPEEVVAALRRLKETERGESG